MNLPLMKNRYHNEAPRSKLRGIKAEFAEANPPSLFELRRVARHSSLQQAAGYPGEGE
jgi:hypothetical protein